MFHVPKNFVAQGFGDVSELLLIIYIEDTKFKSTNEPK